MVLISYTVPAPGVYQTYGYPPNLPVEITYTFRSGPDVAVSPAAQLGFTEFLGSYSQNPFGFLATNFPGQDLSYRGQCYLAASEFSLGGVPDMPNISVEVQSTGNHAGVYDCAANYVVSEFLTNINWGADFPAGSIGSLSQFANYTIASGLFISQELKEQRQAREWIEEWVRMTNSECFYSEGLLKIVPRGDQNVSGNGATYVADTTVQYNLTVDDFLPLGDEDPIEWSRTSPADAYNVVKVEFVNRDNEYNVDVAEAKDQASIEEKGERPMDPVKLHGISNSAEARQVAQLILQRVLYIRNTYKFALPFRYLALEPMDIVTLTDPSCGLDLAPVRITAIDEEGSDSEDGRLLVEAEEFPGQISSYSVYASQTSNGEVPNYNVDPGIPGVVSIIEAPRELWQTGAEVWLAVAGGENWGGCDIFVSVDGGASYDFLGRLNGRSTTGITSAALPARPDPDTVGVLSVDMTESLTQLDSVSREVADALFSLCYLNREWLCYQTATLTAPNEYDLRYLRRGLYQSDVKEHQIGERFIRINNRVFRYVYNPEWVGRTLYFKILGFNIYGGGNQQLAQVPSFPYVLRGVPSGVMRNVSGLQLYGAGISTTFEGRDARFVWRLASMTNSFDIGSEPFGASSGATDPYFKDFKVEIWTADGATLLRTERVLDTAYTYTYEKNFVDNNGAPLRTFKIRVRSEGDQNQLSKIPADLIVSNPAPVLSDFAASSIDAGLEFAFTKPTDPDWEGIKIWVDKDQGFTASDLNLVYSGNSDVIRVPDLHPGVRDYYRYQVYDSFGPGPISSEANAIPENVSLSYFGVHDQIGVTKLVTSIPITGIVTGGTVCPVNNHVYFANFLAAPREIDPYTNSVVNSVSGTSQSQAVVFVPTTNYLYFVGNANTYVIDPRDNSLVTSFATGAGAGARDAIYCPSDGMLWITCDDGKLYIYDPVTYALVTSIPGASFGGGFGPRFMCYCPSNDRVYMGAAQMRQIYAVTPGTYAVSAAIIVGGGGAGQTVGLAYVASIDRVVVCTAANRVDFVDPASNTSVANIAIANGYFPVYCPQNDRLYITDNTADNIVYTVVPATLTFIAAPLEVSGQFFYGVFVPQTDRLMFGSGLVVAVVTI